MKKKKAGEINKCVMLSLTQHLQRLSFQRAEHNNMRGRSRIKYGMTSLYNRAFTLIELLVVVLIIGILVAVAVPQYQKAVLKSRYATLKSMVDNIVKAEIIFKLANGDYADSFDQLDIEIGGEAAEGYENKQRQFFWGKCVLEGAANYAYCKLDDYDIAYIVDFTGKRFCQVYNNLDNNSLANKVCQSETGQAHFAWQGWSYTYP